MNELKTKIYINKKEYKYKKYFYPEEFGEYEIIIKFNINLTDCSKMFAGCDKIIDINFVSFNTKNIINMDYMFNNCKNIVQLDLSYFDTRNVYNIGYMFWNCSSLNSLSGISEWDTKNVIFNGWIIL